MDYKLINRLFLKESLVRGIHKITYSIVLQIIKV